MVEDQEGCQLSVTGCQQETEKLETDNQKLIAIIFWPLQRRAGAVFAVGRDGVNTDCRRVGAVSKATKIIDIALDIDVQIR